MFSTDQVIKILAYKGHSELAQALRGSMYDLNESSTYGSRYYSRLTTVELYAPIHKHDRLQNLSDEDKDKIIKAFHVLYPIRDNDIEIKWIEFFVDPQAAIPQPSRGVSRLKEIDFAYINEQIAKCDEKIEGADFEGAITNARNLLESICKYILDDTNEPYDKKADLPELYGTTTKILNMHPIQHVNKSLKQILSGCFSIVQGLATIRNELSDAHGKSKTRYYKPDKRHANFAVGAAKSLADFMFASYIENTKLKAES